MHLHIAHKRLLHEADAGQMAAEAVQEAGVLIAVAVRKADIQAADEIRTVQLVPQGCEQPDHHVRPRLVRSFLLQSGAFGIHPIEIRDDHFQILGNGLLIEFLEHIAGRVVVAVQKSEVFTAHFA